MQTILVTGAAGFIGSNLIARLRETRAFEVVPIIRQSTPAELALAASRADAVIHLAGENRPADPSGFEVGNVQSTVALCAALAATAKPIPVLFASSVQAALDNAYGTSKRRAEAVLAEYAAQTRAGVVTYRLPNVFGKWCRPDYNSVVATFCYRIARDLPITINDPSARLILVHVDDVADAFVEQLHVGVSSSRTGQVTPQYATTVGELADRIRSFKTTRQNLQTLPVGTGLARALYATYLSYVSPSDFSYEVPSHADHRGRFVEMLKTLDSGQFSYFTALPGVVRGGHYHHTKIEKFLVVSGQARFRFRHILSDETLSIDTDARSPRIVESIPGWSHDVTNTGDEELVVLLWANEVFNPNKPDTVAHVV
jgi:UDP-2-acetamido-2,6-beta-L-arabino-hexul-4-ose reductase